MGGRRVPEHGLAYLQFPWSGRGVAKRGWDEESGVMKVVALRVPKSRNSKVP